MKSLKNMPKITNFRSIWLSACVIGFLMIFGATHAQAQKFPYRATVCEAETFVRSGPGTDFYPTDRLHNGDVVEVYKHTPDGWCAIRPPLGSFSFISARYVQMAQSDLGQIAGGSAPVYVGSRLSPERSQVQITLTPGKVVEVLELPTDGLEAMCKISPPAGEFRWIHGKFLSPNQTGITEVPVPPSRVVFGNGTGNNLPSSWTQADGNSIPGNNLSENPGNSSMSGNPTTSSAYRDLPTGALKPGTFMYYVNQLDADLSYIIASGDAANWETEALLMRANRLMNYAKSTEERNRLEHVRQKIIEADGVRAGRKQFQRLLATASEDGITPISETLSAPQTSYTGVSEFPAPYSTEPGRWDYSGILVRVQRQRYSHLALPPFAIVNEDGILRCYVTPAPNMDLSPYLKKRVALAGSRNYLRDQRAFNLNVQLIVNVW
ncbi:MAG: SH3 domain-containing protein [Planctomycetia bacterium]|nr:SH3 domain-containing protein [Planctomycetia bacterium]